MATTRLVARDARNGRFIPAADAKARPATTVIETYVVRRVSVRAPKPTRR